MSNLYRTLLSRLTNDKEVITDRRYKCGRSACFANDNGYCYALKFEKIDQENCNFYKSQAKALKELYNLPGKLIQNEREDLAKEVCVKLKGVRNDEVV